MLVLFKDVFLCSHISHFKISGYIFIRNSIEEREDHLKCLNYPFLLKYVV